jgi:UDP-hydrolysing UDP-N-acetyl-D-glucosamine 2-epimerase
LKTIGVVTAARSDYGIYVPLLQQISADPELNLYLMVTGMHLAPEFGQTETLIEADAFPIADRVEMLLSSDTPTGTAKSMGLGTIGFAQSFSRFRPDLLVVLGDRFEMFAAALAALPFKIPVAHLHGGEITQGAIDDSLRHSLTKLCHLHFVATQEYARRVVQLGEEPWRVNVTGALALDYLHSMKLLPLMELNSRYGMKLEEAPLLVTFHPVTLEYEQTEWQITELLQALAKIRHPLVFTLPNADASGRLIRRRIKEFVAEHDHAHLVENFGAPGYFSMMAAAAAMVGNSSSGLIEAPSFKLPVVNIGTRQHGRIRAANVIDVGYSSTEILSGIKKALSVKFQQSLKDLVNPYGSGKAAPLIVAGIKKAMAEGRLIPKAFNDLEK